MSVVEADGLRKAFTGQERAAVDGVHLRLEAGRVLALLGSNGSGKTTLIKMLTTLTRASSGTARVCGFDVSTQGASVRAHIGLVGQYAAVDEVLTARANLSMFGRLHGLSPRAARERGTELLERFELGEAADKAVATYSGGMRRRIDLAVALITEPQVLFVDEPTTGLDPLARTALWEQLRSLVARGHSVVLTTQYLEEADALADDVVILREGRVAASGTAAELKALAGAPRMVMREPTLDEVYRRMHTDHDAAAEVER